MTKSLKVKRLALKMRAEGIPARIVGEKLKVTLRTVQRWEKENKLQNVECVNDEIFEDEEMFADPFKDEREDERYKELFEAIEANLEKEDRLKDEINLPPTITVLEKTAKLAPSEKIDLKLTSKLAVQLLNVTIEVIASIRERVSNPETRTSDIIKAGQVVGSWVGLDKNESMLGTILTKLDQHTLTIDMEDSNAPITSGRVVRQAKSKYNLEVFRVFQKNQRFPVLDLNLFDKMVFLSHIRNTKDYYLIQIAERELKSMGF